MGTLVVVLSASLNSGRVEAESHPAMADSDLTSVLCRSEPLLILLALPIHACVAEIRN